MKSQVNIILIILMLHVSEQVCSQAVSSSDTVDIPQVNVTANRNSRNVDDVPGRVTVIDSKKIDELPVQNVDDLLKYVANVHVNRSWGIFSQNASVTMRGLDASARVLVLLNGVPLNKSSGGSVNWQIIAKDEIERIEVIKGPASAIYGNNAMAGVINIITKKPSKKLQGEASLLYGTYNTLGAFANLGGSSVKDGKGIVWGLGGFYRQGDGYYLTPENDRDSIDAKAFLNEYNINGNLGYSFNNNHQVEFSARIYDDSKGQGRKVYEENGDYMSVNTLYLNGKYTGVFNKTIVNALLFYQLENEFKQSESISSSSGKYKLSERESVKDDIGLWINATTHFSDNNIITYGVDLKQGSANVVTTYKTSTDILTYEGVLDFYGLFVQDELKFMDDKLVVVAGARMDFSKYHKGRLIVENPTSNTGFIDSVSQDFSSNSWSAFSPKIAVSYKLGKGNSVYASYSKGFMPPKLDDLSKSGKIRKGFKLANPELGPEYLTNYEIGGTFVNNDKLFVEPSIYVSLGKDFQYFVGTGDSVDTGGDELKPVYQRQNISDVQVLGFEITVRYNPTKKLQFDANYTYNSSTIKDYKGTSEQADITGNFIIEVPKHMAFAGILWNNKVVNTSVTYNYVGSQWYDDQNTILLNSYQTIDIQFSKTFLTKYDVILTIQNILDNEFVD